MRTKLREREKIYPHLAGRANLGPIHRQATQDRKTKCNRSSINTNTDSENEQMTKHPMQNSKLVAHFKLGCMSDHLVWQGTLVLITARGFGGALCFPLLHHKNSSR